jgi:hypothetical protein
VNIPELEPMPFIMPKSITIMLKPEPFQMTLAMELKQSMEVMLSPD